MTVVQPGLSNDSGSVYHVVMQNGIDPAATIPQESLQSRTPSPTEAAQDPVSVEQTTASKKKNKKRKKKSAKSKASGATKAPDDEDEDHPPVLCISRNKHWRYISSYHVR